MTTTNMLEAMASGVMAEKDEKAKGLTPLVSERLMTPASFPNDLPEDAIRGIVTDLVRQHTALGEVIDALSLLIGADPKPGPVALVDQVKQKEREADARVAAKDDTENEDPPEQNAFEADLAAKTAAAQAATFKPATDDSVVTPPGTEEPHANTVSGGWACPNGHDTIEEKVSPRGRSFSRCTTCGEFQK